MPNGLLLRAGKRGNSAWSEYAPSASTLALRSGCCPDPVVGDSGGAWHLIRTRQFKTAVDEDGNHLSVGVERDVPWVAVAPVVAAIRVLERIVPEGELLFASDYHRGAVRHRGKAMGSDGICERITDFITWANQEAARHGLTHELIPPDPGGPVTAMRFRRSLAWYIARQPGGLVALAIQYGHLRLDSELYQRWRDRAAVRSDGKGARDFDPILRAVRAFYADLQAWAAAEPEQWAVWVAPCPVSDVDVRGYGIRKGRVKERMDDRTRRRQPLLATLTHQPPRQARTSGSQSLPRS
ncbi:hypothetical protein ACIHCQ_30230 [Streptomyces sp. NPDC052236]|uniref:hypothetical protein n=1 Tax=Streptomyces sp. NPDC052236 TaxID=3365686 RepID=UPI0037CF6FF1